MAKRGFSTAKGCGALLCLAFSAGAARAESVVVTGWYAAEQREVALLRSVAIGRFAGEDGPQFARAVERAVSAAQDGDGQPYFVLTAGHGDPALTDGMISGAVSSAVDFDRFKRKMRVCPDREDDDCSKDEKVETEVECRRRAIEVSADIRVIRTADDRIIFTDAMPLRHEASWCPGDSGPAAVDGVVRELVRKIADAFAARIVPHGSRDNIRFREERAGLDKAQAEQFKLALRQTKTDMTAACATWETLETAVPRHPATVFNVGLCAEWTGDLQRAQARYATLADASYVRDARARVESRLAAHEDAAARDGGG